MPNILFVYLYRDASNYKSYGQAVFTNTGRIPLADVETQIRATLNEGEWFKAEMVDLETQFIGTHDTEDDHPWHEYWQVTETDLPPSDLVLLTHRNITQFVQAMKNSQMQKWGPKRRLCVNAVTAGGTA